MRVHICWMRRGTCMFGQMRKWGNLCGRGRRLLGLLQKMVGKVG